MASANDARDATARVLASQLRIADGNLRDSRELSKLGSRNAVSLLFYAVETALQAVLTSEGQAADRRHMHQLDAMAAMLPDSSSVKERFAALAHLTGYATTFRYASPAGRIGRHEGRVSGARLG